MIRSVCATNSEALSAIRDLHCPGGFDCDLTFGNGSFWTELPEPKWKFDIQPLRGDVVKADSRSVPLPDGAATGVVFDPPFLTYISHGRGHKKGTMVMSARFGGYYSYLELEAHYRATFIEGRRILAPRGIFVLKCQDIVHNHRLHPTGAWSISWAAAARLRLVDQLVLTAKSRMPGPQKGTQRHDRVFHSYFQVYR